MIRFETSEDRLEIKFKEERIFLHTEEHPCFFLGRGREKIASYLGNFEIDDYIDTRMPLASYEIVDENAVRFFTGSLSLKVTFRVENNRLIASFNPSKPVNRFWMRLHAEAEEHIYGCGAQASYFNLRDRDFRIWTSEGGVGRSPASLTAFYANLDTRGGGSYDTTYYPEPTFISSRKYWCHVGSFSYSRLNFEHPDFHEIHFWEVPNKMVLEFADTYPELLTRLTDYTGRPPKLPDFVHDGVILGLQGGTEKVLGHLDKALENGVDVSALWCQDWAGIRYTSFGKRLYWNWVKNEEIYPKLEKTIQDLDAKGIAFMTYICPFLLQNESLFNEAEENRFLVLNKDGETYIEDFGEFYCGLVDLTNPEAFNWYKGVIQKNLIDLGVKGWMADFGEYLPVDAVLHNGIDAKKMHNHWPVLWAMCNYEAVREREKLGEIVYFMRAGGHGSQRYATSMWAGDQSVNWEKDDGLPSVIPIALSTGMTGIPFMHSDIGGYTSLHGNVRTRELFDRWCELNVFTAYMRTHEGNRPSENFQFYDDEDAMRHMGRMTSLRKALKPYIKTVVDEAVNQGYPMQRPLFFHYEDDERLYHKQDAFMFGRDLLVHPVTKSDVDEQGVLLPNDAWIHLFTKETFHGGSIRVKAPIGFPPVFYRASSAQAKLFESIQKKFSMT